MNWCVLFAVLSLLLLQSSESVVGSPVDNEVKVDEKLPEPGDVENNNPANVVGNPDGKDNQTVEANDLGKQDNFAQEQHNENDFEKNAALGDPPIQIVKEDGEVIVQQQNEANYCRAQVQEEADDNKVQAEKATKIIQAEPKEVNGEADIGAHNKQEHAKEIKVQPENTNKKVKDEPQEVNGKADTDASADTGAHNEEEHAKQIEVQPENTNKKIQDEPKDVTGKADIGAHNVQEGTEQFEEQSTMKIDEDRIAIAAMPPKPSSSNGIGVHETGAKYFNIFLTTILLKLVANVLKN